MFSSRADFTSLVCAIVAHAGIAWGLAHMPPRDPNKSRVIEMEVRKKQPPQQPTLTPPEPPPPPPPPPERKVIPKVKPQAPPPEAKTPPPNETPKEPPKEPVEKIVGINANSTVGESTFSVPLGNTTYGDPSKSKIVQEVKPLPPSGPPPPKPVEYKPVSELFIKAPPEIDSDACGRSITYPDEALQLGIEGQVKLLIGLDERGKVHRIKILKGLGHGLDQVAIDAMKKSPSCRFSAAVANDGKSAPYELEYLFTFEIPR